MQKSEKKPNPRPFSVTLLSFGVLSIAFIFLLRATVSLFQWDYLSGLPIKIPVSYFLATGIIWSFSGFILFFRIWKSHNGINNMIKIFSGTFLIFFWFEQIFVMISPFRITNWLFLISVSIFIITISILVFKHKALKQYFGDMNE